MKTTTTTMTSQHLDQQHRSSLGKSITEHHSQAHTQAHVDNQSPVSVQCRQPSSPVPPYLPTTSQYSFPSPSPPLSCQHHSNTHPLYSHYAPHTPGRRKQVYRKSIHAKLLPLDLDLLEEISQEGLLTIGEIRDLLDRVTKANKYRKHKGNKSLALRGAGNTLQDDDDGNNDGDDKFPPGDYGMIYTVHRQVITIFTDAYGVVETGFDNVMELIVRGSGGGEVDDLDIRMYNFYDHWYESLVFLVLIIWMSVLLAHRLHYFRFNSMHSFSQFILLPVFFALSNRLFSVLVPYRQKLQDSLGMFWNAWVHNIKSKSTEPATWIPHDNIHHNIV